MEVKKFAQRKAKKYGLTLAGYLRYLLINEIRVEEYPVYRASERVEKAVEEAMKEEREGKLMEINDISDFFKNKI